MIEDIFKQYTPCFVKLRDYGFVQDGDKYIFKTCFYDNQFEAVIDVSVQSIGQSVVQGRVFDIANKEEYSPLHIENWQGTFVNEVRSAYKDILLDIRDICFVRLNRVLV